METCTKEITEELEYRTRGQHNNSMWSLPRRDRITASNFHDIKTKKDLSNSDKLVMKFIGDETPFDNSAVKWGKS